MTTSCRLFIEPSKNNNNRLLKQQDNREKNKRIGDLSRISRIDFFVTFNRNQ